MIRYALRCDRAHRTESWFGSSEDYDRLAGLSLVVCSVCGSERVEKDLMAPAVAAPAPGRSPERIPERALSAPASPAEQALAELRRRIEATSEDVGRNFATEARAIHEGESPHRSIIGEATAADARALHEDGIPVARLPWSSVKPN